MTIAHLWEVDHPYYFRCTDVKVCKADEPAVRQWLTRRAEHMRTLWEPLLDPESAEVGAA